MPDAKTMGRWGVAMGPTVINQIHDRIVQIARGGPPRCAGTQNAHRHLVETNIHYPTWGSAPTHGRSRGGSCAAACRQQDDRPSGPSRAAAMNCPGSFGGRSNAASRFSSSAIRTSAANCPTSGSSARIRSSFSATVSLLRSISGVTGSLNRGARDRVNHHLTAPQTPTIHPPTWPSCYPGEQLLNLARI